MSFVSAGQGATYYLLQKQQRTKSQWVFFVTVSASFPVRTDKKNAVFIVPKRQAPLQICFECRGVERKEIQA